MFGDANAIKIVLERVEGQKLEAPNNALSRSNSSNKGTYASWIRHFDIGRGRDCEIELEAMLRTGCHGKFFQPAQKITLIL